MKKKSTHNFIAAILVIFLLSFTIQADCQQNAVTAKWLSEQAPDSPTGVSWGVPWPQGKIEKGQQFLLTNQAGDTLPVQTWDLAYWPDGSLKWTGFSTVTDAKTGSVNILPAASVKSKEVISVVETPASVRLDNGVFTCIIPKSGSQIIESISARNTLVGTNGRIECILTDNPGDDLSVTSNNLMFTGNTEKITVEQNGPLRAVIRVQGMMKENNGRRKFLPFDLRLYFYAGTDAIRLVNTIIYDGNEDKDFIKGLNVSISVPMREELQNRHVRFAGELPGVWAEPVKPLTNRAGMLNGKRSYPDQLEGLPVAHLNEIPQSQQTLVNNMPFWNDYKLMQNNPNGFTLQKRTNRSSAWVDVNTGKRAGGLVFLGDIKGGVALGVKDFWQSYPAALEISNAAGSMPEVKAWLWSPYSEIMDMRHYDTVGHGLAATYEDVQEGLSTPYGVGRTSELMLYIYNSVPTNASLSNQAEAAANTPRLMISPEYLHSVGLFGRWSLPDRSVPGKAWIENQLDMAIALYQKEVDQRSWYGFWNYGDVMHAYDANRHTWNYDIGGYAWDNTELGSDLWLWYSFIRTGRPDIFRMAEAMTRHTSEVDVYHLGELKGLGSRHNVRHWGCGSKEVRESQSAPRRFYFYLTTDERTGDIMREVAENADFSMSKLDPLRLILPKTQYPTHARIGPDWLALTGNWMTEWERTGDKKWLDYIYAGINSFSKMPYGFYSGQQGAFGYDPATKKMYQLNDEIGHIHLSALMGGPEVAFELSGLINNKKWDKLWLQFCELWGAPKEEIKKAFGKEGSVGQANNNWYSRLPAYVYTVKKDPAWADKSWQWFLNSTNGTQFETRTLKGDMVLKVLEEAPSVTTNTTAQWCLNAIEILEMAGDRIPSEHPLWKK